MSLDGRKKEKKKNGVGGESIYQQEILGCAPFSLLFLDN